MSGATAAGELDARYSSEGATATAWEEARDRVAEADVYLLSTVRPNGRPHVTPLLAVWDDERIHFCTGPDEQKARNLAARPLCAMIAGSSAPEGLDVVVEGEAAPSPTRPAPRWCSRWRRRWSSPSARATSTARPAGRPAGAEAPGLRYR
jgi:hypothetical protein